ncbi:MAG: M17 family peptidase N-terminal domain-containing protein [Deltaproteobacteria bacterium]|nr:M17 family peptidase N-terminal domain-containing protein [Deltaproteobacteria bacterium]
MEFNLMDVIISQETIDLQETDLLITGLFQDERPLRGSIGWIDWRLNGMLSRFLIENRLTGEWRERTLIPSQDRVSPKVILLFGLGKVKEYSYLSVREVVPFVVETIKNLRASNLCFSLPYGNEYNVDCGKLTEVLLEGLLDGLDQYPSDRKWIESLTLFFGEGEKRFSEILLGVQTAKSILTDRLQIRILTHSEILPKAGLACNL